jgi:hypothetical protein
MPDSVVPRGLIAHLERHLGEIDTGWRANQAGEVPFSIVRFTHAPGAHFVAYSTLGLSHAALASPEPAKHIHHELIMLVPPSLEAGRVASILEQAGSEALDSGTAYLRGEVIGPRGPLFPNSQLEALYVAIPVYLPDEFAVCRENGRDIVLAWLVPIANDEAAFVATHGWKAFEDRLVELDPDLVDLHRTSTVLDHANPS